ncbi:hypothetical protein AOQ84DRAFT_437858 [Glonium stellatum]|uniref:Aminodeoxychorismate lyase n=1 Tax=Glonium stellatum TaxID=574774 RepID=A0A8E2F617_9PEZI|nr:hypothetical protein AOQ84DRAFT_437858 [Glonium stellatum]
MSSSPPSFELFTSLRYDPILLASSENSSPVLSFHSPSPFYMLVYHRDRMLEAAQHFGWVNVANKLADGESLSKTLLEKVQTYQKETGTEDGPLKVRILFDRAANLSVELAPVPAVPLSTLYPPSLDPPKPPSPPHPANTFKPSPLTGGALSLGLTDSLPASPPTPETPTWILKLDPIATPITPFTSLKTTHRDHYTASRNRTLPDDPPSTTPAPSSTNYEVLLHNPCNELTEGSMTSLYLYRGGRWVTPPVGVPAGHLALSDTEPVFPTPGQNPNEDEGEMRTPFPGRWGHSVRSEKVGSGGQRGTTRRWALGKGLCMEEPVLVDTVEVGEGVWICKERLANPKISRTTSTTALVKSNNLLDFLKFGARHEFPIVYANTQKVYDILITPPVEPSIEVLP